MTLGFPHPHRAALKACALALALWSAQITHAADAAPLSGVSAPFLDVTISASVPGIISTRLMKEGDFVKEGDVIFELDQKYEELEAARRKLVVGERQRDYTATDSLYKSTKSVSKEERDKKEAEFRIAVTEHDMALEQLRKRRVAAPLAGTIVELHLNAGEACQSYQPLARIVDTRQGYLICNVEAKFAAPLKLNQPVNIEIDGGDGAIPIKGRISFISPVADPASGLIKIKAIFDNPDGRIKPGLAGRILP